MNKHIDGWISPRLNKYMEIVQYGHWGDALLLLPTAGADYLEYERFGVINALYPLIDAGKIKVFSINSINRESWLNNDMHPRHKSIRHVQFNNYVYQEVIPYIRHRTSEDTPIITAGASLGALHAANLYFKKPDLLQGTIAMSGVYDLSYYTKGYHDEDVYFNSPVQYLSNLNDPNILQQIKENKRIVIASGSGDYESPEHTENLSQILSQLNIRHKMDIWGNDISHDWPTWRKMLPYFVESELL